MGPFRTLLNAILRTGAPLFVDTTVTTSRNTTRSILPIIIGVLTLTFAGCQNMVLERADRDTKSERLSKTNFELEVDPIMRGTVASEGIFTGYEPTVVRGYGLVVGLSGTGSRIVPAQVRSLMLAEMTRRGVGDPQNGWNGLTPERMLDSEDTAIVVVEGVIPPGAPKGTEFDVRVFALPGSTTSSLEGGRLYTTELRPGPLATGSRQAFALAKAKGPIFINPFVEPGKSTTSAINALSGRILEGGSTQKNMPVKLRMATTSHARTATVQQAINSNFPREPGQKDETARGESGDSIAITVPPSHADETERFMKLLQHTSLKVGAVEASSQAVRRALLANPGGAESAKWRWFALGPKAVPMIHDLYDYPEEAPRLAALSAGAQLDDALVVPYIMDIAEKSTSKARRISSVRELGNMGNNPRVDIGLRKLLNDDDVDIRLAAFEALLKRGDPIITEVPINENFVLNIVPSNTPMLYIAQSGTPRIVLFDSETTINTPLTLNAWSGQLMMKADLDDEELQVFYRQNDDPRPVIVLAPTTVRGLVNFLGHKTSVNDPEQGLGMSYGQVIGALHQLWLQKYISCDFKAEQDRILAAILAFESEQESVERPEFDVVSGSDGAFTPQRPGESDDLEIPARSGLEGNGVPRDTVPR